MLMAEDEEDLMLLRAQQLAKSKLSTASMLSDNFPSQFPPSPIDESSDLAPVTTLIACADKCYRLVSVLYNNQTSETLEFLSTVAYCDKILQACVAPIKQNMHSAVPAFLESSVPLLRRILSVLEKYESNLVKLINCGKLSRFLSNSRVKKKLEGLNVLLHAEVQKLEKKADKAKVMKYINPDNDILTKLRYSMAASSASVQLQDPMAKALWSECCSGDSQKVWQCALLQRRDPAMY
jgi:hypothetical protein